MAYLSEDISKVYKEGRLLELEGVGKSIANSINSYFPNLRRDLSRLSYKLEFNKNILIFMENLRKKKGLDLPNYLFLRDAASRDPRLYDINEKYGKKWLKLLSYKL